MQESEKAVELDNTLCTTKSTLELLISAQNRLLGQLRDIFVSLIPEIKELNSKLAMHSTRVAENNHILNLHIEKLQESIKHIQDNTEAVNKHREFLNSDQHLNRIAEAVLKEL